MSFIIMNDTCHWIFLDILTSSVQFHGKRSGNAVETRGSRAEIGHPVANNKIGWWLNNQIENCNCCTNLA